MRTRALSIYRGQSFFFIIHFFFHNFWREFRQPSIVESSSLYAIGRTIRISMRWITSYCDWNNDVRINSREKKMKLYN